MKSVQRLDFLTQGDPAPENLKRKARRNLSRFKLSELHDHEARWITASHEAGHAFISILTGERILDVWVSEFSSRVNRVLGIYEGHVAAFETSVYKTDEEDAFKARNFDETSEPELLLDSVNFITGSLNEYILVPESLDLVKIKQNLLTPIDELDEEDDFSLFQETFLAYLDRKHVNFSDLDMDERELLYGVAVDLLLDTLIDFLQQPYIQKVIHGIAKKFLKESRMRGPHVKGQILQALREEGVFAEDFTFIKADLSQRLDAFEADLEKKLANLLESP
ncbi:MAG: hypothetical protein AAB802_01690 [Patescibacteria group bacterium]